MGNTRIFKTLFFCVFLSSYSIDALAEQKRTSFILAESPRGEVSVAGSIVVDNLFRKTQLSLNESDSKNSIQTLSRYYTLAKKNDKAKLRKLSYVKDGSYSWMSRELNNIPDKFEGFAKLRKADAAHKLFWGDYELFIVDWFTEAPQKVMSWYEAVICVENSQCHISNLLLNGKTSSSIFSSVLTDVYAKPLKKVPNLPYSVSYVPKPISDSNQNALVFNFDVEWLNKPLNFNADKKSKLQDKNVQFTHLESFLRELWAVRGDTVDRIVKEGAYKLALGAHWLDFSTRNLIPVIDPGSGFSLSNYTPVAYLDRLSKIDEVKVEGVLHARNETYVIMTASLLNQQQLVIITLDRETKKLKQTPNNFKLQEIVNSPEFYRKMASIVNKRA